jgi:hypothetical protein
MHSLRGIKPFAPDQGAQNQGLFSWIGKEKVMTSLPRWVVFCLYAAGAGIGAALLIQHWVHVPLVLPWLIFLACPIMHTLMHRHHSRPRQEKANKD